MNFGQGRKGTAVNEDEVADSAIPSAQNVSRADRTRSLDAMFELELVLSRAAPGRERQWDSQVLEALRSLEEAVKQQAVSYDEPTSLLAEIAQDHPRLRVWVRQLQRQWNELAQDTYSLREQLEQAHEPLWNYADVRQRIRWLLTALHHHRAREADLVFEALSIDLGGND